MNLFTTYLQSIGVDGNVINRKEMIKHAHDAIVHMAAKYLRSKPSEKRKQASRDNGAHGGRPAYTEKFEEFWKEYPRHVAKGEAFKAYRKVEKEHEEILKGVLACRDSEQWSNKKFIPHPTTYLNQRRWDDDVEVKVQVAFIDLTKKK